MSRATKRKHVVKEVQGEHMVPSERQQIVRVLRTPGNNLHEVETAEGQCFLVSMPSKYRKNIWIKRGDFLIVDPIEEGEKVKAEIIFVLRKHHMSSLQKEGHWPAAFSEVAEKHNRNSQHQPEFTTEPDALEEKSSSEDDSDLFVNTNRRQFLESEEESEEEQAA